MFGAIQRRFESLGSKGLHQVIHRMHFEGTQRVLVVGSYEDDSDAFSDQFQNLETIELRHLSVEKNEIRF